MLGVGAYWLSKTQFEVVPTSNQNSNKQETATTTFPSYGVVIKDKEGWNKYKNDQYGFEFKYPQSLLIKESVHIYKKTLEVILSTGDLNVIIPKLTVQVQCLPAENNYTAEMFKFNDLKDIYWAKIV